MLRIKDRGLQTIAAFEAAKGFIVLLADSGLLLLIHRNAQEIVELFVSHLHLNPAKTYPRIFLGLAAKASSANLTFLALGALAYSAFRFVEAVGLWKSRRWAAWVGAASAVVYVPFEAAYLVRHPGFEPLIALALNLAIIVFLSTVLWRKPPHT